LKVTNNATSAGTLSYAGSIDFAGGTPVTVTATTDAVDVLTLVSLDGSTLQCVGTLNFS
jgi:ammonia channel protein AmtB